MYICMYIYTLLFYYILSLSVCVSVCLSVTNVTCVDYWKTRASPQKQNVYSYVKLAKEDNESSPKSLGVPVRV